MGFHNGLLILLLEGQRGLLCAVLKSGCSPGKNFSSIQLNSVEPPSV